MNTKSSLSFGGHSMKDSQSVSTVSYPKPPSDNRSHPGLIKPPRHSGLAFHYGDENIERGSIQSRDFKPKSSLYNRVYPPTTKTDPITHGIDMIKDEVNDRVGSVTHDHFRTPNQTNGNYTMPTNSNKTDSFSRSARNILGR
jgi:hypothetical protein